MDQVVASGRKMRKTIVGYVPLESPLYKFHPLTRLSLFIITGFLPIYIDMPEVNLLFICFLIGLFRYARVNISSLKIYTPMFITVGLFMFLSYYLAPGKNPSLIPMGKLFGVTIFFQPMRWFIVSYVRIIALLLAAIFYFSSNRERDILVGLRSAKVPFVISYFIGLCMRSAGMFLEDLKTIREAEQARGLDSSALTFRGKLKHYSMYMIPLFTLALRRGEEISSALFAKGYGFSKDNNRADYARSKLNFSKRDLVVCIFLILAFAGLIFFSKRGAFNVEHSLINRLFAPFLS